jgi:ubiquinone/menaquinone biosynthesis C-methylase UbiE
MEVARTILKRMFGRPEGMLGRFGGIVMARVNRQAAAWGIELLGLRENERVLEIGFGPGVAIDLLARSAPDVRITGIDPSSEMVRQARKRNAAAIARNAVDLRQGSADDLPFDDDSFDAALAINSMQAWPDAMAGLREVCRVVRPGGRPVLVFTPRSGQARAGITELLSEAGFDEARLVEGDAGFAALARKPHPAS